MDAPNFTVPTMTTSTAIPGGGVVCNVTAAHQLSAYESQTLQAEFLAACEAGAGHLAIGLAKVEFMSSAALGVLVTAHKACGKSGQRLVLFGLRPEIVNLLKMTHLDRLFRIVADEPAAVKALTGK